MKELKASFICGFVFAISCLIIAFLGHGMTHHFPWVATVFWWLMSPSFLVLKVIEDYFGSGLYGNGEFIVIFITQFVAGVFACFVILTFITGMRKKLLKGDEEK